METRLDARNAAVPAGDTVAICPGCPHTLTNLAALAPAVIAGYHRHQRACQQYRQALAAQGAQFTADPPLRVGDLSLAVQRRQATRAGQRIDLSPRETELLAYLLRHAGDTCPLKDLLAHVWHYHGRTATNVVAKCIERLRAKIDAGFDPRRIETVHGKGYRLTAESSEARAEG